MAAPNNYNADEKQLRKEPQRVREVCGSGDDKYMLIDIRNDNIARDLALGNEIPFQVRQFGCSTCDHRWWKQVPTRKMVSRCNRCRIRYEAVPKENEWGLAKCICRQCGNKFLLVGREMAAPNNYGADKEQLSKARRIRELFHGRFQEDEALRLLEHCNWDVFEAVGFTMREEPEMVREVCGSGDDWIVIRNDRIARDLALRNKIPFQVRQFGCGPCDHMWWRRVPTRKLVSRCKRCRTRHEAVPEENEWGWAKFICPNCRNEFHGFGQMNNTWCPCYNCGTLTLPEEVLPPFRRPRSRRAHRHSCAAPNCFNRADGAGVPHPNICVHPKSLRRRVVTPSTPHNSTGSTISTVLTQDDILSFATFEPIDPDISEDENDNGDNPCDV